MLIGLSAPSPAQEATRLSAISAFQLGTTFARPFERFVDWVNENGAGLLTIDLIGGPEAMPPFELGNALEAGIVDLGANTAAFYANLLPLGDALHLAGNTVQDQRENGCFALFDRMHQEQMNVKYLARTGDGIPFNLYLSKPLDGPDLTGLTIRTTPVYRGMFRALGATVVRTPPGEVYSALERGMIDGYGWPAQGVLDLGWGEQTAYRVEPGFYQVNVNFLINLDRWNALSAEQRDLLERGAAWIEASNADNPRLSAEDAKAQAEAGINPIVFTGADREKWLAAAEAEGWKPVEAADPEQARILRACLN